MDELLPWIYFHIFILTMLGLDLFVFHQKPRAVSIREAIGFSIFWVSLAFLFNIYIYFSRGMEDALNFLTGYLIEESLSIDNLFVFLLIFKYFKTPEASKHKVLFWGVLGAIIMRALFIWFGILLISKFHWIIYVFGLFLILTGLKLWFEKDKDIDPEFNPILRIFRHFFHVTENYVSNYFFIIREGKYFATPLFIVLLAIETTDVVFAVDSIPAILAITHDPFIVYTSNIFAILGLRSLFFALSHMLSLFHYIHYGLSFILVFIGIKMLLMHYIKIPTVVALGIVFMVLAISITLSILYPEDKFKKS